MRALNGKKTIDLIRAFSSVTRQNFTAARLQPGSCTRAYHRFQAAIGWFRYVTSRAELRPSAWTQAEWDLIGQHDHTFPGIAATNRYAMKATFYAAQLLEFIDRIEAS